MLESAHRDIETNKNTYNCTPQRNAKNYSNYSSRDENHNV